MSLYSPQRLRQRKLDDFIKSELHRLSSRLDATDVRIQRLISGEAPANPKQFVDAGRIRWANPRALGVSC